MLFDFLEVFNLFPYSQLWRVSKQPEHNSRCSIITSLFLILAVGALFMQRLVTVFQKDTMESTQQTVISPDPPPTIITTYQGDTQNQPFMFAIDFHSGHPQYNLSNYPFNIKAWISNLTGPIIRQRLGYNTSINLEPCTKAHFSIFQNIDTKYDEWKAYNWLCLPLNQNYILQGSYGFSNTFTRMCLMFNCSTEIQPGQTSSCMDNFHDYNIKLYTLSVVVNPTNSTTPQQHFLEETTLSISRDIHQEYSYDLTENFVEVDRSIYPWTDDHQEQSLQADTLRQVQRNVTANESSTFLYFHRSPKTIIYDTKYLQLVDALSFVGGIFEVVMGTFFFMLIFGRVFFQFKFARRYFKTDVIKTFSFRNVIQQLAYKGFKLVDCDPGWQNAQERWKYQQTVNHMLDIVYLQRRIDTLERALPILLEEHQITGLYLAQPKDRQQYNQNYKNHQLRDRMIGYLDELLKQENQRREAEIKQMGRTILDNRMSRELIASDEQLPSQNIQKLNKKGSVAQLMKRNSLQSIHYRQNREIYAEKVNKAAEERGTSQYEPIEEHEMRHDILPSLKALFNDMEKERVDERSRRIYENLDPWMKEILKNTLITKDLELRKRQSLDNIGSEVEQRPE